MFRFSVFALLAGASWATLPCLTNAQQPPPAITIATQAKSERDKVHVFFIDGFDPSNLGRFSSLRNQAQGWGFKNAYYFNWWETSSAISQIQAVHANDPDARIVLVGYSLGSIYARNATDTLRSSGVNIETLVYLGGDLLKSGDHPSNAKHVVNVRGWGYLALAGGMINGVDIEGAENYNLGRIAHANMPMNGTWLNILQQKLDESAVTTSVVSAPTTARGVSAALNNH